LLAALVYLRQSPETASDLWYCTLAQNEPDKKCQETSHDLAKVPTCAPYVTLYRFGGENERGVIMNHISKPLGP